LRDEIAHPHIRNRLKRTQPVSIGHFSPKAAIVLEQVDVPSLSMSDTSRLITFNSFFYRDLSKVNPMVRRRNHHAYLFVSWILLGHLVKSGFYHDNIFPLSDLAVVPIEDQ